ncbi:hypothetical protein AVEN_163656-1, partial [Araneus ventricosus]
MASLDYSPSFGTFRALLRSAVREKIEGHTYIHTYRKVELSSENNICKEDEMFLRKLLYALLQISVLLHAEENYNSVKFVEDIVLWIQDKLLRPACMEISLNTSQKRSRLQKNQQSAAFEQFTFEICN